MINFTEKEATMILEALENHYPTNNETEYFTGERERIEQTKKDAIIKLKYSLLEMET